MPASRHHALLQPLLAHAYPAVMGVLNVTPDSFSDGGQFTTLELALTQAKRMIAEGADILDIGAESTRPYGSEPVSAEEERQRLQAILPQVVALGRPVSIDTMKASVAAWALGQERKLPTTYGACSAIQTWRVSSRTTTRPLLSCITAIRSMPISTSCRI